MGFEGSLWFVYNRSGSMQYFDLLSKQYNSFPYSVKRMVFFFFLMANIANVSENDFLSSNLGIYDVFK